MDETEGWEADNFKPVPIAANLVANKWEGEDEEDEVKDSWEDEEEEEKKDVEKQEPVKVPSKKSKKYLADRIEEKERREREEAEKKAREKLALKSLSPEEAIAEKLRRQKLQEESDLRLTLETFGVPESSNATGIDAMNPSSKEEFDELEIALSKKILTLSKSTQFPEFAEKFMRNICAHLSSNELKKFKTTVENMFLEKSKIEKGDKAKKNKGKGKAKLKIEGENSVVNYEFDDFDDFM